MQTSTRYEKSTGYDEQTCTAKRKTNSIRENKNTIYNYIHCTLQNSHHSKRREIENSYFVCRNMLNQLETCRYRQMPVVFQNFAFSIVLESISNFWYSLLRLPCSFLFYFFNKLLSFSLELYTMVLTTSSTGAFQLIFGKTSNVAKTLRKPELQHKLKSTHRKGK